MLTGSGWSYALSGKLAKAPKFDTVPDFDKTDYSLFKVHTHVDKRGFIWVNLDAANPPTHSWEEQFSGVDEQERLGLYNMKEFTYDHTWEQPGSYNWKTLIDNYNEVNLSNLSLPCPCADRISATTASLPTH